MGKDAKLVERLHKLLSPNINLAYMWRSLFSNKRDYDDRIMAA